MKLMHMFLSNGIEESVFYYREKVWRNKNSSYVYPLLRENHKYATAMDYEVKVYEQCLCLPPNHLN